MPNIQCTHCHKEFHKAPTNINRTNFCSKQCWSDHKTTNFICLHCGIKLYVSPSKLLNGKKFCSRKCKHEHPLPESMKAKLRIANLGKTMSEETKRKIGLAGKGRTSAMKGRKQTIEARGLMSLHLKGRKLSEEHKQKLRGPNSPNWRGGVTLIYHTIRSCLQYRQWRDDIFTRDNFTCTWCGDNRGGNLRVDHIEPFTNIMQKYEIYSLEQALKCEALWSLNNGRTLCETCHIKRHENRSDINTYKVAATTPHQ